MARPTSYNQELLETAKQYVFNHEEYGDLVPSIAGLADAINIRRSTIYAWAKHEDKQEFSDTLDQIENKQHKKLLTGGLTGDMNPTIVKLMLCNHGYSDKQDNTLSAPDGGPVQVQQIVFTPVGSDD